MSDRKLERVTSYGVDQLWPGPVNYGRPAVPVGGSRAWEEVVLVPVVPVLPTRPFSFLISSPSSTLPADRYFSIFV